MKTKGRRQSKNVSKVGPTDGYRNSSMFSTYSKKSVNKHLAAGSKASGPVKKKMEGAAKRDKAASAIREYADRKGMMIQLGMRKGPRVKKK